MRIFKWVGAVLGILIAILLVNTFRLSPEPSNATDAALPDVDGDAVAELLSQAIQFKTISHPLGAPDRPDDFQAFLDWVAGAFPHAVGAMDRDLVSGFTPIFLWRGSAGRCNFVERALRCCAERRRVVARSVGRRNR